MQRYYKERAQEYEEIYRKPERQADLRQLEQEVSFAFPGMDVFEVACGTGYWTQFIARSARSIHATDVNSEVLEFAQQKEVGSCSVSFELADAFDSGPPSGVWNAAFHGFWWSHIPVEKIGEFLQALHSRCRPGAKIVMLDNRFVEGSSTPISRVDPLGNTYQMRQLKNGSQYEVLKNFPSEDALRTQLRGFGRRVEVHWLEYYWMVTYESVPRR